MSRFAISRAALRCLCAVLVAGGGLLALAAPGGADGTVDLVEEGIIPPLENVCADFTSVGMPMAGDGESDPTTLDVPGPPIAALLEWSGYQDMTPPPLDESELTLTVTAGPAGPVAAQTITGTLLPGGAGEAPAPGGETVYTWVADLSDVFTTPGDYTFTLSDWDSTEWFNEGGTASWGATVTVVYDLGPCVDPVDISWRAGADLYWGGETPDDEIEWGNGSDPTTGHVTEPIVFEIEPSDEDRVVTVQVSSGGIRSNQTDCRRTNLWYVAGTGTPSTGDLVTFDTYGDTFAPAVPGGVEIVRDPFHNASILGGACAATLNPTDSEMEPGHPCPNGPDATCPYRAVALRPEGGGFLGPEWALLQVDVIVPAGSTWVSFQLESPTDQFAENGVSAESGAFGGQFLLLLQSPFGRLGVTKTLSGDVAGYVPGTEFTIEVDCDNDAFDTTLSVVPDVTEFVEGIPLGTECTVTETAVPAPGAPTYGQVTYSPGQTVTISAEGVDVIITVTNPLSIPSTTQFGQTTTTTTATTTTTTTSSTTTTTSTPPASTTTGTTEPPTTTTTEPPPGLAETGSSPSSRVLATLGLVAMVTGGILLLTAKRPRQA